MRVLSALLLSLTLLLSACEWSSVSDAEPAYSVNREGLAGILERDTLVAVTGFNPISYFMYRGEPLGYEYELLQAYAEHLGVGLRIIVEKDADAMFERLRAGEADLVAYRLVSSDLNDEEARDVVLTNPLHVTRQVLIQQIPAAVENAEYEEIDTELVNYPFELIGDTIFVPDESGYARRLENLIEEIGGNITIQKVAADVPIENLIRDVSEGTIKFTVASEDIAQLNQAYYENVAVNPALSVWQRVGWAVPAPSDSLLSSLNTWLETFKEEPEFKAIYRRYFEDRVGYRERLGSEELIVDASGHLSDYDDLLRQTAASLEGGWDWRLLAAQMFQESRFRPDARSWAGAQGLMQLMPATARQYGVTNAADPEQNVAGAVRFLNWLDDYWAEIIPDPQERLKFVLASYNTGHGHVEDARRLAEKFGKDPDAWEDVAYYLLQKSKPEFYQDPVVRYGYSRGIEPVTYVRRILARYEHYRNFVT